MNEADFNRAVAYLKTRFPGAAVTFRDEDGFPFTLGNQSFAITFPGHIHLPERAYCAANWFVAIQILFHEGKHLEQYEQLGALKFALRYATASGRLALEAPAYAVSCKFGGVESGFAAWLAGTQYEHAAANPAAAEAAIDSCLAAPDPYRDWAIAFLAAPAAA